MNRPSKLTALRELLADIKIRVINVVDLMRSQPSKEHPHELSDEDLEALVGRYGASNVQVHSKAILTASIIERDRTRMNLRVGMTPNSMEFQDWHEMWHDDSLPLRIRFCYWVLCRSGSWIGFRYFLYDSPNPVKFSMKRQQNCQVIELDIAQCRRSATTHKRIPTYVPRTQLYSTKGTNPFSLLRAST